MLVAHGVRWWSPEVMAADFELQRASLRTTLNQAVLHVALAWPPEETGKISDKLMVTLTEQYLEGMGINPEKTQWALIRHYDQAHPHGHLIVNRVTNEGEAIDCGKNFQKSHDACRELEQKYELIDASEIGDARHRALVERRALGEGSALALKVRDAMDEHVVQQTTLPGLISALATARVTLVPGFDEQGALRSVVFTHEDHPDLWVKGSALRLEYGGRQLGETLARHADYQLDPPWVEAIGFNAAQQETSKFMLGYVEADWSASEPADQFNTPDNTPPAALSWLATRADQLAQALLSEVPASSQVTPSPQHSLLPDLDKDTKIIDVEWEM